MSWQYELVKELESRYASWLPNDHFILEELRRKQPLTETHLGLIAEELRRWLKEPATTSKIEEKSRREFNEVCMSIYSFQESLNTAIEFAFNSYTVPKEYHGLPRTSSVYLTASWFSDLTRRLSEITENRSFAIVSAVFMDIKLSIFFDSKSRKILNLRKVLESFFIPREVTVLFVPDSVSPAFLEAKYGLRAVQGFPNLRIHLNTVIQDAEREKPSLSYFLLYSFSPISSSSSSSGSR